MVIAAADTYRAAAMEQLETWAERAGAEIVRGNPGGDPGAVVFDAVAAAEARGADVVIADTAGRLHTHGNLMDELAKVRRVVAKRLEGAPHETLIVIDATTGQNGLRQAKVFADAVDLTGVVLTKLDGTAKGGIALAIAKDLDLPVKLIGVGEGVEDLRPFDAREFASLRNDSSGNRPGMEIERKFVVGDVPDLGGSESVSIEQGYLALAVRRRAPRFAFAARTASCLLTVKGGTGKVRAEEEIELDAERFDSLWPLTDGRRLAKTRYLIPLGEHTMELDVYEGELEGLVTAEVEFGSER